MRFRGRKKREKLNRLLPVRDQKDPGKGVFTRRALLIMAVQTAALGELGRRLYDLQVNNGDHFAKLADKNRTSKRLLAPPRGLISDRFGTILAANKTNWRPASF